MLSHGWTLGGVRGAVPVTLIHGGRSLRAAGALQGARIDVGRVAGGSLALTSLMLFRSPLSAVRVSTPPPPDWKRP